jgi:ribosomal protein L16 Arg81 hydroxylase
MLYVPPGWWHYVRALTVSFSVSFWWGAFEAED